MVWTEWTAIFDSPVDVVAARISSEGRLLDPLGIRVSSDIPAPVSPAVASNGKDYLVVWDDWAALSEPGIHGARITADGQVAGEGIIVINRLIHGERLSPAVAGGNDGYIVAWQDGRNASGVQSTGQDIYGTRVDSEGVVLDVDGFPICTAPGNQGSPSVAQGSEGFLIVWGDSRNFPAQGDDIYGARLDRNGTVLDTNGIVISTAPNDQWFPSVAASSNAYLVVWQDFRNSTVDVEQTDIYATLVSPAGEVSNPKGIVITAASGEQSQPAVAASSQGFLVVWNDRRSLRPGIYAARVSVVGVVLDPEGVAVDLVPKTYTPAVAASDDSYLVVWSRSSNPLGGFGSGILGARLNSQAEVIDTERILITAKGNDEASPAVASNGTNWLVVWEDWRNVTNGSDIYGVRIAYDGRALDCVAIPISTQASSARYPRLRVRVAIIWWPGQTTAILLRTSTISTRRGSVATAPFSIRQISRFADRRAFKTIPGSHRTGRTISSSGRMRGRAATATSTPHVSSGTVWFWSAMVSQSVLTVVVKAGRPSLSMVRSIWWFGRRGHNKSATSPERV